MQIWLTEKIKKKKQRVQGRTEIVKGTDKEEATKKKVEAEQASDEEKTKHYRQWHPVFLRSLRLSFRDAKPDEIEIISEEILSKAPLEIDFFIIKKQKDAVLTNPISRLFRRYNVIEYKSPYDRLALKNFDKGLVYARLHQLLNYPKTDMMSEYTISYFSSSFPFAMIKRIMRRGLKIEQNTPVKGIYRVYGEMYPIQIVVMNRLDSPETMWPFTPYINERKRQQHKLFYQLYSEGLKNPDDNDILEIIDFILKYFLINITEWEEVSQMIISPEEREKKLLEFVEVTERSPLGELLTEKVTKEVTKKVTKEVTKEVTKKSKSETLINLLTRKLGILPQELQNQLSEADIEKLELILNDIFVINSPEEVEKYLGS